jgi:hypothetical protein
MSVKQAQCEIDSAEFSEWLAYWQLEPWGQSREDLRIGILAALYANTHRASDATPYAPDTFFPNLAPPPVDSTAEDRDALIAQQQALLEGLTRAVGGEIR